MKENGRIQNKDGFDRPHEIPGKVAPPIGKVVLHVPQKGGNRWGLFVDIGIVVHDHSHGVSVKGNEIEDKIEVLAVSFPFLHAAGGNEGGGLIG